MADTGSAAPFSIPDWTDSFLKGLQKFSRNWSMSSQRWKTFCPYGKKICIPSLHLSWINFIKVFRHLWKGSHFTESSTLQNSVNLLTHDRVDVVWSHWRRERHHTNSSQLLDQMLPNPNLMGRHLRPTEPRREKQEQKTKLCYKILCSYRNTQLFFSCTVRIKLFPSTWIRKYLQSAKWIKNLFLLIIYSSRWFLVFEGSENTFRTVVSVDFVVWWFGLQTTWCWAATLWLMVIHERHKLATDLHLQCVFQKALLNAYKYVIVIYKGHHFTITCYINNASKMHFQKCNV